MRNDTATIDCPHFGTPFTPTGRRQWCTDACRQTAWRRRRAAPRPVLPARDITVYECPVCDTRYLGQQRCNDCNTWCRRIGPGGNLPPLRASRSRSPTSSHPTSSGPEPTSPGGHDHPNLKSGRHAALEPNPQVLTISLVEQRVGRTKTAWQKRVAVGRTAVGARCRWGDQT